jgi:FkbM family methyltransferase
MSFRSAGIAAARLFAPFFSSRAAQTGVSNAIRFLQALQGVGTGSAFTRREFSAVFAQVTEDAPTVFDVGAHSGRFLNEALERLASDCTVHAFEPAQFTFRELSKAVGVNRRVQLNRVALSAVSGTGVLFYDVPGSELASLTPRPRFGVGAHSESVRLETLDEYCQKTGITQIHLLKLDVEGHELEVLEGAHRLLDGKAIRRILLEFGGCNVDTRVFFRDIYEFLTVNGMKIRRLTPSGALIPIEHYGECLECFHTTNYLAVL